MDILGQWECEINHALYKGKAYADISKGDPYQISLSVNSPYFPKVQFFDIKENGNELNLTAKIDLIPLHIKTHITVEGDRFHGVIHIPFIGEIQMKDGKRIAKGAGV